MVHTPPNQDGRATPSPEHVVSADSEETNNFDDNHSSLPGENHSGFSSRVSDSSTNNTKNAKDTEHCDENFNSFHYWRSPLPDISGELEMLSSQKPSDGAEDEEEKGEPQNSIPDSTCSPGKATSDQIQKVLDCLQPHMDDPDVQGGYTEPQHFWISVRLLRYSSFSIDEFPSSPSPGAFSSVESSPARQPDGRD